MRRVCIARSDEHGPEGHEPYITESGLAVSQPTVTDEAHPDGDLDTNDDIYEIDKVLYAIKVGNRYRIYLKWKGYDDV